MIQKKAFLYCDKRSMNDATTYYVGIIRKALESEGFDFYTSFALSGLEEADVIITITERYFFLAKLRYPSKKTIYWAQGIGAEEARMASNGFKSTLRYRFRLLSERFAVNKSTILFCVSDRMVRYFEKKYGYKDKCNCIVMPCYNLQLSDKFEVSQYDEPTFVYAGGSSVWQGVDFMLEVFQKVQHKIPKSKLIICTGEKEVFKEKICSKGIQNYEIMYVPVNQLQDELHRYKYGFIIRDGHIVNEVATPTKMNSYLANYLIPIFSEAVDDFKQNIRLGEFTLMANLPLSSDEISKKIIEFELSDHNYSKYQRFVQDIFNHHYNDEAYKELIISKINEFVS